MKKAVLLLLLFCLCGCVTEDSCVGIEDLKLRDACYSGAAISNEDHTLCGRIQNSSFREVCYSWIAFSKLNASICEKLEDEDSRKDCVVAVLEAGGFNLSVDIVEVPLNLSTGNVSLVNDRGEYAKGETVWLTVENGLSKDIFFDDSMIEPFNTLYLECFGGGNWSVCEGLLGTAKLPPGYDSKKWMQSAVRLPAGGTYVYEHTLTVSEGWDPYWAEKYRFRMGYTSGFNGSEDWLNSSLYETVYSNEFVVSELNQTDGYLL